MHLLYGTIMWLAETPENKRGARRPWPVLGAMHIRDDQKRYLAEAAGPEFKAFLDMRGTSAGDPCVPYTGRPTPVGALGTQVLFPLVAVFAAGFAVHLLDELLRGL